MPADPGPLYAIAAELELRAAVLRARAALVGACPQATRWSSPGARAWADAVGQIQVTLVQAALQVEQGAADFRSRAAAVCG